MKKTRPSPVDKQPRRPLTDQDPKEVRTSPGSAAAYLTQHLGETVELWLYRLANWRRPGRHAPLAADETVPGHPMYSYGALDDFVNAQLARRVVVSGLGDQPRARAMPLIEGPDKPHVRVSFAIGSVSQSVFAIDAASARNLAELLTKSAAIVDKANTTEFPEFQDQTNRTQT